MIGLFKLSIPSWFSFGGLYVSRKLSVSSRLGCEICWHVIVHNILLFFFFLIFAVSVVIFPLSFLILFIWVFSLFFLVSLAGGLSVLFTLSKNQLLVLLIFFLLFLITIYFLSDIYYLLPSNDLRFCLLFF